MIELINKLYAFLKKIQFLVDFNHIEIVFVLVCIVLHCGFAIDYILLLISTGNYMSEFINKLYAFMKKNSTLSCHIEFFLLLCNIVLHAGSP